MAKENIIEVQNLKTYFHIPEGIVKSVDGVSFSIEKGKTMALVGESGCGKTQTSLSLIRLLAPTAKVSADKIEINGKETKDYTKDQARGIRGKDISMIFQEPMTSLNPVYRVKRQLEEMIRLHQPELSKQDTYQRALNILTRVGIPEPQERIRVFPHQLSGGLRQRVMIAIALASNPRLLIADEPTTALDVTIQAQIIELLKEIQKEMEMSILLITHDFGVVSQMADTVSVMYAGKIVEQGSMKDIFEDPWHPYTRLLIMSIPGIKVKRGGRLETIEGAVPNPMNFPPGCRFYPRCPYAEERCMREEPVPEVIGGRMVRCLKRGVHDGR
ncbi:MAG: ABC transporter ATP-binding protein [Sakamotonia sp.]|jgi:peptide/nickel transport system ATP-binding protein